MATAEITKALSEAAAAEHTKATQKARIICVIGGPAVGKGTHCTSLAQHFPPLIHLSIGALLRAEATTSSAEDAAAIQGPMTSGGLVQTERVQAVLEKHLLKHIARGKHYFLLDGFPRSLDQARAFESRGWDVEAVLHFHASEEVMRARMLKRARDEHRTDDTVETHAKRLAEFDELLPAIIDYYGKSCVYKVDCDRDFDVVYQELPDLVKKIFLPQYDPAEWFAKNRS
ncbi:MAG: hypothetical protein HETSPECPRED_000756 [Heterodermia speciosa]|uniref:Adenylate kinase n=1 Tax=Heterodermia speciosa TaxID=116794 RepID=A0A8H3IY88_9LECA|nr:MAG: hypothetical protein HETSPECPRED_000756 [Heterodermia speciosa]